MAVKDGVVDSVFWKWGIRRSVTVMEMRNMRISGNR